MKALICGDRNWGMFPSNMHRLTDDEQKRVRKRAHAELRRLYAWCDVWHQYQATITQIIEGEANGADTLGRKWGEVRGIKVRKFPAEWKIYGKAAGPMRNTEMLTEGEPDVVFAFHNDIRSSKGTANMVSQAKKAGVETWVITLYDAELVSGK